jgi:hypothetical protein
MATYTPAQMAGSGVLSTQSFTSGSTVTITITNKPSREVGSVYFTISAPTQDPTLPLYFVGSTFVPTNVGGIEVDTAGNHWACVIPSGGGTSSLTWTTAVTIPLGGVYIQGNRWDRSYNRITMHYSALITGFLWLGLFILVAYQQIQASWKK